MFKRTVSMLEESLGLTTVTLRTPENMEARAMPDLLVLGDMTFPYDQFSTCVNFKVCKARVRS